MQTSTFTPIAQLPDDANRGLVADIYSSYLQLCYLMDNKKSLKEVQNEGIEIANYVGCMIANKFPVLLSNPSLCIKFENAEMLISMLNLNNKNIEVGISKTVYLYCIGVQALLSDETI